MQRGFPLPPLPVSSAIGIAGSDQTRDPLPASSAFLSGARCKTAYARRLLSLDRVKSALEIGEDIVDMLRSDRQTDGVGLDVLIAQLLFT